jgi:predicted SAM-dependent methyltransferase
MAVVIETFPQRELRPPGFAPPPPGPRLNLGCGPVQPEGWINIDASRRAWLATRLGWLDALLVALRLIPPTEFRADVIVRNLLKPLPYSEASVSCIYAGEVLEHFELPDAVGLARECLRVLAPGGVLRICVPDGAAFWRRYIEIYDEELARPPPGRAPERLIDQVGLYFHDIATRRNWLGSLGHTHKWQFDEVQLTAILADIGFDQVRRMRFHDSRIPDVARLERSDFLIVEAVKPSEARQSGAWREGWRARPRRPLGEPRAPPVK